MRRHAFFATYGVDFGLRELSEQHHHDKPVTAAPAERYDADEPYGYLTAVQVLFHFGERHEVIVNPLKLAPFFRKVLR